MTHTDRILAFIEGRYTKGSSGSSRGERPAGGRPENMANANFTPPSNADGSSTPLVGTPDAGTTQSAGSTIDSANYTTFEEMLDAYQADVKEIEAGDKYGNNIVELYNPLNYIGAEDNNKPTWTRILCGASEGDISMLNSLNIQIAWLNAGTDAQIEWQWDGGHVPSEIFGDSLTLYVDMMYGKYVDSAVNITKASASTQTTNGTATEMSSTDISSWVNYNEADGATVSLSGIAAYRTSGASKAIPGFDVMDYGQEDYVFGSTDADARHWSRAVLEVFEANKDILSALFN